MGRYYALTLEANAIPLRNRTKTTSRSQTNWNIWLLGFLAVLGAAYLLEVNSLSTKGYEIKKLEKQTVALKEVEKRLELESAALQSIQQVEASVKFLNLVPSKEINYPSSHGYAYEDIPVQ